MEEHYQETQGKRVYDTSIIRPQIRIEDLKQSGQGMSPERLKDIRKGLRTFHNLETMAVNIYKFQITNEVSEHNRRLIAAMCNEMTHVQDFQIKLFEYGWKPSILRLMYWIIGFKIGFISRLMGMKIILKTGIWAEAKAVHHYDKLLKTIDWEEGTRKIIEKDQADEHGHIETWKALLSA